MRTNSQGEEKQEQMRTSETTTHQMKMGLKQTVRPKL